MLSFILTWVVSALGVLVTAWIVPGLAIAGVQSALIAAPLFGVVNAVVKPILTVLTLPLTILSLGLFLFVVNAIAFGLVGYITPGFHVDGFFAALFGSVMLSIVSSVLDRVMAKFTGESSAIEQV